MSNKESSGPEGTGAGDKEKVLKPEEVKAALLELKKKFSDDLIAKLGSGIKFPNSPESGAFAGREIGDVLAEFAGKTEHYEPPVVQEESTGTMPEAEKEDIPEWLKGHEGLIWKGAPVNPLWKIQGRQYENTIAISYERRGRDLKPGRSKLEQGQELAPIANSFTLDEWKIVEPIFREYEKLQEEYESSDPEISKKAKKAISEVAKEESSFRHGKSGVPPAILKKKVEEFLSQTGKTKRGFKKDAIDVDVVTQKVAEALSQLFVLNHDRGDGTDHIPQVKKGIKEIPSFQDSLRKLTTCAEDQREGNKGLSLIIGEAGVGKNEAVEYFSAQTRRPFFWFPCGRGMEAVDLVIHYEFDTKEGLKRFFTALAEGVQTPGAVVMIDEVNSLKPEVQAILHGLGDSNRSLNYDGVRIPVPDDVIIIVAGNPATYGSAGNFGQALLSRTRGQSMTMEYPALREGELMKRKEGWSQAELEEQEKQNNALRDYACDEALVLYGQLNEFSGLSDEDFTLLWNVMVNEKTHATEMVDAQKNRKLAPLLESGPKFDHIQKTLLDLRDILAIADEWRKKYGARKDGLDVIGVSMRDTIALVSAYKKDRDVKKAYLKTFDDFRLNPIEGLDVVYKRVETLIDEVLKNTSAPVVAPTTP